MLSEKLKLYLSGSKFHVSEMFFRIWEDSGKFVLPVDSKCAQNIVLLKKRVSMWNDIQLKEAPRTVKEQIQLNTHICATCNTFDNTKEY